jgi:hypothetical protein
MNPTLHTFYNNENERETVKAFMIETLKEIAIERAFNGEDIKGIPDAKNLVEVMFSKLEEVYGQKKNTITHSPR